MADLYKGMSLNTDRFPMPDNAQRRPEPTMPEMDIAEMEAAANELQRMMQAVKALKPAMDDLTMSVQTGARQQGYADGLARAQAEVQQQLVEAMAALTDAAAQRHKIAQDNEDALAELALRIARKVIGAHLDADPTLIARIVEHSIAELEPSTSIIVKVCPADLAAVEANRAALTRLVKGSGKLEIVGDPTVNVGGCILSSPVGDVDARIETKLSVLETAFAASRRQLIEGGE
jgi:flagellar biosynthesis/type III secretory pathway protein FliH